MHFSCFFVPRVLLGEQDFISKIFTFFKIEKSVFFHVAISDTSFKGHFSKTCRKKFEKVKFSKMHFFTSKNRVFWGSDTPSCRKRLEFRRSKNENFWNGCPIFHLDGYFANLGSGSLDSNLGQTVPKTVDFLSPRPSVRFRAQGARAWFERHKK